MIVYHRLNIAFGLIEHKVYVLAVGDFKKQDKDHDVEVMVPPYVALN